MMLSWRAFLTRRLTHAYFASRCVHDLTDKESEAHF